MKNIYFFYRIIVLFATILLSVATIVSSATLNLSAVSDNIPWSGYWWPATEGALVNGYRSSPPSPLGKYDLYTNGSYPGSASSWEYANIYDPDAPVWYGYCYAWANASVSEPIDFTESALKGIFLLVGDKKGLVTLAHADDQQLLVNSDSPIELHQFLLEYIGEQKIAFVADLDAGEEVWAYPVYGYEMTIDEADSYDDFTCRIQYASNDVIPDFIGTKSLTKTYTYRLEKDSSNNYISGEWTNYSIEDHPEFLWLPISQTAMNPYLDYEEVIEIASSTGDETDNISTFAPGHYAVVLHPGEDKTLSINVPSNSNASVSFVTDRQAYTDMVSPLYDLVNDTGGQAVASGSVTNELQTIQIDDNNGSLFSLNLSAADENPRPDFIHVYVDISYAENHYFVNSIENDLWSAIVMTNHNSENIRLYGTFLNSNSHLPRFTLLNSNLSPNLSAFSFLTKDYIPADCYTDGKASILRISSDSPLEIVALKGDNQKLFGPPNISSSGNLKAVNVIPELTNVFGGGLKSSLTFYNQDKEDANCSLKYLTMAGSLLKEYEFSVSGSTIESFQPGAYPGKIDFSGWALFSASTENIIGNVNVSTSSLADEIPFLSPLNTFYLPLLAVCENWQTWMTLFNTSPDAANVELTCYNGSASMEKIEFSMNGYEKKYINVLELFENIDDPSDCNAWLYGFSSTDVAGYITYKYSDEAVSSIPFYDEDKLSTQISLGLSGADATTWWTSFLILNTADTSASVKIVGYDKNGIEKKSANILISAKENYPVTTEQLFKNDSYNITHLKIQADIPVMLFSLYGNKSLEYISGVVPYR